MMSLLTFLAGGGVLGTKPEHSNIFCCVLVLVDWWSIDSLNSNLC